MNIKETFLNLTKRTYPHGTEQDLFHLLPSNLETDEFGNKYIMIGDSPSTMFTSHLDTASSQLSDVNHTFDGDLIRTDGKSILGADDKAGVTIMMYMIEKNKPGLYYFFLGEEVGCIGSKKVAEVQKKEKIEGINKVISFDRRGTSSIITYQTSRRCCSDAFGEALSKQLNDAEATFTYKNDDTGVLTDSVQFISIYPECTNISVGYYSEHTFSERQDIDHLTKLAEACLKVDWTSLPVERDFTKTEYKTYTSSYGGYYGGGWDDDYSYGHGRGGYQGYKKSSWNSTSTPAKTENVWFHDNKYNYLSKVEIESLTKKVVSVDLCKERIDYEQDLINDLLTSLDIEYVATEWDGFKLKVYYKMQHTTDCTRNDLMEYLPELDYSKGDDLGEKLWSEKADTKHDPKANGYDPDWEDWSGGFCDSF
jgi:hypothetical protein